MTRSLAYGVTTLGAAILLGCGDSAPTGPDDRITVQGIVADEYGTPLPSREVLIVGHAVVTTDADGHFTVTKVRRPYDLLVMIPSSFSGDREVLVYAGLSRADPLILTPPMPFSEAHHGAYFWGSLYGGAAWPLPPHLKTTVFFESQDAQWGVSAGWDHYTLQPSWLGPQSTTGVLHALQWEFDSSSGLPGAYTGYGSVPLQLSDGGYFEGPSVTMGAPVESGAIAGVVNLPSGFAVTRKIVRLGFLAPPGPAQWEIITDSANAASFSYVTPNLAGATFSITARAEAGDSALSEVVKTGIGANAADVALSPPPPPTLVTPTVGSHDVTLSTKFSWTRVNGAVYLVAIRYADQATIIPSPLNYYVLTTDTTVTLADVIPGSLYPYPNLSYVWEVRSWAPFGNIDDVAVPTWFVPPGDHSSTVSATKPFRWAP